MADQELTDEGASPRELVLEACRRNNTELLEEVIADLSKKTSEKGSATKKIAELLNEARDGIGNHCLHLAARNGSYEILDILLDQEGLEVDPLDRMDKETPLHKAVRFVNELPSQQDWEAAKMFVELLLDAGADPRVRNKARQKPIDLVDSRNAQLKSTLERAEYAILAGDDIVNEDEDANGNGGGSASDSE
ncbi:MAG: hypothetical protein M1816_004423 [Peltula sp. TS41687]|nr:MAG: hypothetical protein M1816_004423 [Peltula sp. TS41687]